MEKTLVLWLLLLGFAALISADHDHEHSEPPAEKEDCLPLVCTEDDAGGEWAYVCVTAVPGRPPRIFTCTSETSCAPSQEGGPYPYEYECVSTELIKDQKSEEAKFLAAAGYGR